MEAFYDPAELDVFETEGAQAMEVQSGDLILFDGNLTHWGHPGVKNDRTTYIMHISEGKEAKWSDTNWIQRR